MIGFILYLLVVPEALLRASIIIFKSHLILIFL